MKKNEKKVKTFINYLMFFAVIFTASCKKEQLSSLNPEKTNNLFSHLTVENGIYLIDSAQYVTAIGDSLANMSNEERQSFEKKMGMVSMETAINEIDKQIELTENMTDYEAILQQNQDLLVADTMGYQPIVPIKHFRVLINKNGYIIVGKNAVKITDRHQIYSLKGNLSDLEKFPTKSENLLENNSKINNIEVFEYISQSMFKSTNDQTVGPVTVQNGDKRCALLMAVYTATWQLSGECDKITHARLDIRVENWTKPWIGGWKKYATICSFDKVKVVTQVFVRTSYVVYQCNSATAIKDNYYINDYFESITYSGSSVVEVNDFTKSYALGDDIRNNTPMYGLTFAAATGRATNRGVGGLYAILCYNPYNHIVCAK